MNSNNLTYNIRIVADTEDDIFIDVSINSSNTFLQLHDTIINGFNLGGGEMASFYKSNENWDKGPEITLMDMSFGEENTEKNRCMENTQIHDILNKKETKVLYLYDFLNMNIFYIDLVDISTNETISSPKILGTFGEYEIKKEEEFTIEIKEEKSSIQSEIDDILNEYDEDNFGSFDELDEDLY